MNALRNDSLLVGTFLSDKDGPFDFTADEHRPCLSTNVYNPTDEPITITIPPKSRLYLRGQFANAKYNGVSWKFNAKRDFVTFKFPVKSGKPIFNSSSKPPKQAT